MTTSRSDDSDVRAEVMRLHYLEGLSMRAIARRLSLARRTVQRHLAKLPPAQKPVPAPRTSLLDPYDATIRSLLKETPELKTPQVLERLVGEALGGTRVEARPDSSRYVDVTVVLGVSWRPPPQPFSP